MNVLRYHTDIIASLCLKLCSKLTELSSTNQRIEIDMLFGQLTVDVILNVAFQMNINSIDDPSEFQSIHESLRFQFEVYII